ncbi:MAG: TatD family hydrolase [Chloroflexota bacterium]|nr:TatD family hydrolase [Chloroflexota bacterium]
MPAPSLVDTHCHLNFRAYADDLDAVMKRACEARVRHVIVPAIDLDSCAEALALAQAHSGICCALGIHPNSSGEADPACIEQIRDWSRRDNVIAIGEIGLDYYWDKSPKHVQIKWFELQLELAAERGLPVIIHNREAGKDLLDILESWAPSLSADLRNRPGVLHSFSGDQAQAERALALGFYLGFTGPLTFKNAGELRDIARSAPLDRLLIETDGPFLTPHPYRGKRNEPAYLPCINDKLAELHGLSPIEMARQLSANAEKLFSLSFPPDKTAFN